jgi:hypothetical protein
MRRIDFRSLRVLLVPGVSLWVATAAHAADTVLPTHFAPLPLNAGGATPWAFNPAWFALLALVPAALLWAGLAWKRALDEDPHRIRRAGSRELRRLLARLRRLGAAPQPIDLHAWCQASARTWGVQAAAPTSVQVTHSLHELAADDASVHAHWETLWTATERSLYGAGASVPDRWVENSAEAAAKVQIPPRATWLPNHLRHWLPSLAASLCTVALIVASAGTAHATQASSAPAAAPPAAGQAGVGPDASTAASLAAIQVRAGQALRADWNNWAAHYDVAAQQMVQGNWNYAAAHLTSAFLQHPSSTVIRDDLRASLQQAGTIEPTLRRLLYGAWFQRYPVLLSPTNWQRLGLLASMIIAGGLCAVVLSLYMKQYRRQLLTGGRWAVIGGVVPLLVAVTAWNAWGNLHRADIGVLVDAVNLSPMPTDLVTEQETSPVAPGTLTLPQSAFLSWRNIAIVDVPGVNTGWVRSASIMPLYRGGGN